MKRTFALAIAAVALVAAGCGSSDNNNNTTSSAAAPPPTTKTGSTSKAAPAGGGKASNLTVSADPSGQLKFDKSSLSAKAGKVTITMDNPSSVPHGIGVQGASLDKDGKVVNKGGKSTVTATLKKGKYTFYCPVPGHRQAGMQGTLTVQ